MLVGFLHAHLLSPPCARNLSASDTPPPPPPFPTANALQDEVRVTTSGWTDDAGGNIQYFFSYIIVTSGGSKEIAMSSGYSSSPSASGFLSSGSLSGSQTVQVRCLPSFHALAIEYTL